MVGALGHHLVLQPCLESDSEQCCMRKHKAAGASSVESVKMLTGLEHLSHEEAEAVEPNS